MKGLRALLYGPSGGGKSHFLVVPTTTDPYPILAVDTEDRLGDFGIPTANLVRTSLDKPADLDTLYKAIIEKVAKMPAVHTIGFDSASTLQVLQEFRISGGSGQIRGYEGWGDLGAGFVKFTLQLGALTEKGYNIIFTAHQGEMQDPLWIPPAMSLDPLRYRAGSIDEDKAPKIAAPHFDGAFQRKVPYYFDFIVYVQEVLVDNKTVHRYFFDRRGMFIAKKPPSAAGKVDSWEDNVTWQDVLKKLGR